MEITKQLEGQILIGRFGTKNRSGLLLMLNKVQGKHDVMIGKILDYINGQLFMYTHQWVGEQKYCICEQCKQMVEKNTPCLQSKFIGEYNDWNSLKILIEGFKNEK